MDEKTMETRKHFTRFSHFRRQDIINENAQKEIVSHSQVHFPNSLQNGDSKLNDVTRTNNCSTDSGDGSDSCNLNASDLNKALQNVIDDASKTFDTEHERERGKQSCPFSNSSAASKNRNSQNFTIRTVRRTYPSTPAATRSSLRNSMKSSNKFYDSQNCLPSSPISPGTSNPTSSNITDFSNNTFTPQQNSQSDHLHSELDMPLINQNIFSLPSLPSLIPISDVDTLQTSPTIIQTNVHHTSSAMLSTSSSCYQQSPVSYTPNHITTTSTSCYHQSSPTPSSHFYQPSSSPSTQPIQTFSTTSTTQHHETPSSTTLVKPKRLIAKPKTVGASLVSNSDDLTSLSWLQSLDMGGVVPHLAAPPTPPASPPPSKPEPPAVEIDYTVDGSVKPPFSYASLIGMAMKENNNKMTLSAIYKWIREHFIFYKTADQSWQNSIRHNLSLNKCFLKVARSKDEKGKGGFWKLDPQYADSLIDGIFKKRRPVRPGSSATSISAPPTNRTDKTVDGGEGGSSVHGCKKQTPAKKVSNSQQKMIRKQVEEQQRLEDEEKQRQQEQEEAVRSLMLQPAPQTAFMPPLPHDGHMNHMYIEQRAEPISRTILCDEPDQLKDELNWSSLLGEDMHDDAWRCASQEVVTDITQSGDPSTYHASPIHTTHLPEERLPSFTQIQQVDTVKYHTIDHSHPLRQIHALPSFELSPESLGVEDDLFGTTPEYSETSNDAGDGLIMTRLDSFDLSVGLDMAVTTTPWEAEKHHMGSLETTNMHQVCMYVNTPNAPENCDPMEDDGCSILLPTEGSQNLVQFEDIEGNLTQLTPLEPVEAVQVPVVVQHVNHGTWNQEQHWEDAKTFSLLEANLDFDKLIDLDVM